MRNQTFRPLWLIFLLIAVLAAACSPAGDGSDAELGEATTAAPTQSPIAAEPSGESAVVPSPAVTSTPAAAEIPPNSRPVNQEPVIILHQSGGFAGVMNKWEIFGDGSVTAGAGVVSQVPREAVAELLQSIWGTGFFDDEPTKSKQICCDFFVFTLTVRIGAAERTHEFNDGDEAAMESVRLATTAVQDFLAVAMFE